MSRGLNRSEEWLRETELRLKAQNKQKDVHMAGDKPKQPPSPELLAEIAAIQAIVAKPKQFTKNEKAKLKVRGIKPVVRIPTEHEEQCAVIQWCDQHPIAKHIFAIPNGSHKSPAMAAKFKREGLRSGVPDLFLPVANAFYHGLFIEMKRRKGSKLSDEQKIRIDELESAGYAVEICLGAGSAIDAIKWYLTKEI